jgi:hypothetical protein
LDLIRVMPAWEGEALVAILIRPPTIRSVFTAANRVAPWISTGIDGAA